MNEKLYEILQLAKKDRALKEKLIATKTMHNPVSAFCDVCKEIGFTITPGELIAMGEDYCDTMIRSVNGGGVNAPFGVWDDMYDIFFTALESEA